MQEKRNSACALLIKWKSISQNRFSELSRLPYDVFVDNSNAGRSEECGSNGPLSSNKLKKSLPHTETPYDIFVNNSNAGGSDKRGSTVMDPNVDELSDKDLYARLLGCFG